MSAWLGRVSAVLLVGLASFGACRAETDLFAYVTNEWYQCRKDNVLRVAVERLADNPCADLQVVTPMDRRRRK